ncbi:hypothetical protein SAMN05444515_10363 [Ectothiorhodospira marina]|uniref:Uncharacterized protein n=1 Tax=Ectothiorhodospira marina TaxID=1396821 RepID=A0A1H7IB10_9GAMM|nr:hypothetical protein SAMN05444515_10363 [Ectothiorhodospira marina]
MTVKRDKVGPAIGQIAPPLCWRLNVAWLCFWESPNRLPPPHAVRFRGLSYIPPHSAPPQKSLLSVKFPPTTPLRERNHKIDAAMTSRVAVSPSSDATPIPSRVPLIVAISGVCRHLGLATLQSYPTARASGLRSRGAPSNVDFPYNVAPQGTNRLKNTQTNSALKPPQDLTRILLEILKGNSSRPCFTAPGALSLYPWRTQTLRLKSTERVVPRCPTVPQ